MTTLTPKTVFFFQIPRSGRRFEKTDVKKRFGKRKRFKSVKKKNLQTIFGR